MFMIILKSLSKLNRNIKLILLFFILALTSRCSFAQRVNEYGLKMVSEIEYQEEYRSCIELIKFRYDEHNRLIRMSVYHKWIYTEAEIERMKSWTLQERKEHLKEFPTEPKLYRDFIKTSDGLAVKDYGSYNYSPLRWETAFDCYGNINSISVFEEFEPGAIRRDVFNLEYERDDIDNTFRLSRYSHTETSKRQGQKSWYGTTVGTTYRNFYHKEGFTVADKSIEETYSIDYEHINDTNINLLYFFGVSSLYGGGMYMSYFTLTEWLPCRSKYFINRIIPLGDLIKYSFGYDRDNNLICVSKIEDYRLGKTEKITIKYLY